ncbi:MAG: nuclear transport factor 2 family protein [Candidatus Eremiobacteraeota bacterium]|nr:nuclear transport factor 2 family protein [Candidatus Eremiobacteraeota bacterium]
MSFRRFLATAIAIASTMAARPAAAQSDAATMHAIMGTVQQYVDAFNAGDAKGEAALCTSPAAIIDDFPPHAWHGPTACADWAKDFVTMTSASGSSDQRVTLLRPWHVTVDGPTAYVVNPTTYTYKLHGKPTKEMGVWTLALRKTAAGWRIASWAWADR